jgi:hypothetical protein
MDYDLLALGETMLALLPPAGEAIRDAAAPATHSTPATLPRASETIRSTPRCGSAFDAARL